MRVLSCFFFAAGKVEREREKSIKLSNWRKNLFSFFPQEKVELVSTFLFGHAGKRQKLVVHQYTFFFSRNLAKSLLKFLKFSQVRHVLIPKVFYLVSYSYYKIWINMEKQWLSKLSTCLFMIYKLCLSLS